MQEFFLRNSAHWPVQIRRAFHQFFFCFFKKQASKLTCQSTAARMPVVVLTAYSDHCVESLSGPTENFRFNSAWVLQLDVKICSSGREKSRTPLKIFLGRHARSTSQDLDKDV